MNYTQDLQKLFLEMMIADSESYVRVQNIFNIENFDRSLRKPAEFIAQHCEDHKAMPTREQVKAMTSVDLKPVPDITDEHYNWFFTEFEKFTRQQELNRAILDSADLHEKGEFEGIEKLIKDALQISLTKDMGTDYFDDPRARLLKLRDNNGQVSTGWPTLDRRLFGGMNKGELNIFAGGSGSGKSLFMQNISVNWCQQGLNGAFISLELSEELCSMRIDSMISGLASREIFKNLDDVELKVKMFSKKAGNLQIKYMPAQSNVNDIRAYLKELQVKTKRKIDFIMIDYLDLLMPISAKVSPSDLFVKDKYVSEELRNLAKELDILFITASQLNRSAVEEVEFDHSMISGGISKINTADNLFGIFTSRAMKERGIIQLQLMKTRSSSGVGQKIDLGFDMETLRISDIGENSQDHGTIPASDIMKKIKDKQGSEPEQDPVHVKADVQGAKLRGMLDNLRK